MKMSPVFPPPRDAERPASPRKSLADAAPPLRESGRPMPRGLFAYVWKVSGGRQIWLSALSIAVFLVDLVPIELQRRLVNAATERSQWHLIVLLSIGYVAVTLLQGGLKLAFNILRSSIGEGATRMLRLLTRPKAVATPEGEPDVVHQGVHVSLLAEADPVGGFVGMSFSEPLLHGGVLLSVFGYMLVLQPWMALVCLAVFIPQLAFLPVMQGTINRRTKTRIKLLREVSVEIVDNAGDRADDHADAVFRESADRIYEVNMSIFRIKFTMNFLMNLLNHLAVAGVLLVGGWLVAQGRTEVGTIVAFISGLARVNDPWGDLVNYFRELAATRVKYRLIADAVGAAPAAAG
jgi:ABC-type multidrug transport system fused ATPase/permease subunit